MRFRHLDKSNNIEKKRLKEQSLKKMRPTFISSDQAIERLHRLVPDESSCPPPHLNELILFGHGKTVELWQCWKHNANPKAAYGVTMRFGTVRSILEIRLVMFAPSIDPRDARARLE